MHTTKSPTPGGLLFRCALLCCIVLLAAGCSERRSEQQRAMGDTNFGLGRFDEARAAYQQAAEINPDNPMAQVGLARMATHDGNNAEALTLYERARGLNASLPEAYLEPVKLLVDSGDTDGALAIAQAFEGIDPQQGGLLHAAVLLKGGRTAEAITNLEKLREQFPESPEVQLNLGVAYSEGGRPDEAATLLNALADGGSTVASAAQLALIEVYEAQGKVAELATEFETLAAANPADASIQLGYARVLLLAGRTEEAEAKAREVLEKEPESGWANFIVGAVKANAGAKEEAVAFLEKAAAALPEEKAIAARLEEVRTGKVAAEAAPTGDTALATGPQTWRDLWKQAALKRLVANREQYLAEGGEAAREVLVLSALFTQNIEVAREMAAALPETSRIGEFMKAMDSREQAQVTQVFENWRTDDPEQMLLRDNALGYAMASGQARSKALSTFLFCLERWPDNVVALYNIAQVFRSVRQPVIAAQQLQRLIVQYPDNIDAHQMLYAALREGRLFDQARKAAEASFSLFPDERWSFLSLGQAYLDTGEPEMALQVLNRAAGMFPEDPEILGTQAAIYARLGDCTQANSVLGSLSATAPPMVANRANLIALCAVMAEDWTGVAAAADIANPEFWPPSLRVLRCVAFVKAGDQEAARRVLTRDSSGEPWGGKLGLILTSALGVAVEGLNDEEQAWAATLGGDPELFVDYGATIALQMAQLYDASWAMYEKKLAPRAPHIALAQLGFAALQYSDRVEAPRAKAEALAAALSGDARVYIALAELYKSEGDGEAEAGALRTAVEKGPDSADAWSRLAALQDKQQDYTAAAESYRKLLALQPESAAANNNLAYMLLKSGGDNAEALQYAAKALEKRASDPGILHTLGLAQLRAGDLEASRDSLEKASEIDPANPTISFDFGRVLHQLGDTARAKERIRYAVGMSQRAGLDFPEREEAERMLTELN